MGRWRYERGNVYISASRASRGQSERAKAGAASKRELSCDSDSAPVICSASASSRSGHLNQAWTSQANTLDFRRRHITPPVKCSSLHNSLLPPNYTNSHRRPTQDRIPYHPSRHLPPASRQGTLPPRIIHLLHRPPQPFPRSPQTPHNPHGRHSAHRPLARNVTPHVHRKPK
jgi:hypothetical protein